jgi:hypothetical protein
MLRKNALGDAGFGALCAALSANAALRRLDVAFNHITDASVPALVALVAGPARASALASIDLTGNLMTAAGMAQARVCDYMYFQSPHAHRASVLPQCLHIPMLSVLWIGRPHLTVFSFVHPLYLFSYFLLGPPT